jgi:outer membrane protein assembly factor BamE (lipoprotein component of BamABCDE complex)
MSNSMESMRPSPFGRPGTQGACLILLLAATFGSSGCAFMARRQTDQPVLAVQVAKVEKGMTKGQVTDILGAPQEIIFSNKMHDPLREHSYIYEYKVEMGTAIFFGVINFGNLDQKRDRVIVFFGDDEKVSNVAKSLYGDQAAYGFPFGR